MSLTEVVFSDFASVKDIFLCMKIYDTTSLPWEEWRDIPWYEWLYQVSNLGRVKRLPYKKRRTGDYVYWERILKPVYNIDWYHTCLLYNWGGKNKRKNVRVHRLVAMAFIPNEYNKPTVNHINWIRDDNRLSNLEWNTHSENNLHSFHSLWRQSPAKWKPSVMAWKFWSNNHLSKPVIQYSLDWIKIKEYECVREASEATNTNRSFIWSCCRTWKPAKGNLWKFKI